MTRAGRNLNIRLLRSFLNDVAEGVFGQSTLTPKQVGYFFDMAKDMDLIRLQVFMNSFTSNLEANPEPHKRRELEAFVMSLIS